MNQQINTELMWKNQILTQPPANGNSFDDKGYHGSEKVDCDRSISNSFFNQFSYKLTPNSKVKEYKNYAEIEPGSFDEGAYMQNSNNDPPMSKIRLNTEQLKGDELLWFYLDPRSNVQGPFLDSQMFHWWSQGIYFQNSLLMKRKCDADFSTLQDYSKRFNGVPFNRKDIRVPPLAESLTVQSPTYPFIDPKMYANGPIPTIHRHNQQVPPLYQLMGSAPNSSDEITKLLHKVNLQQRIPPQMGYEQSHATSIQNGIDPFLSNAAPSSLSNFVNLRLSNPQSQSVAFINDASKTGHIGSYMKNERLPTSTWTGINQPKFADSVWKSTSDDTILSSNPLWSRSTNEPPGGGPSLLNSIFNDSHHKHTITSSNQHMSNAMQETWDNLDPAIIKIVPLGESSNHSVDNKLQKENISFNNLDQKAHSISNNPPGSHSNNVKHPWADLVRNNSTVNQKSKSGFSSEHETVTNHSVSPNQCKASLSSDSSDEYDQRTSESSDKDLDCLVKWCKSYLENKPGIDDVDIDTLIEVLIYVESPYEVEATMRENVPDFDNICEFVKIFIEKRRPLRQRLFSEGARKKNGKSPSKVAEDAKWQVKSKSHGSCRRKRKNTKN